jgi:hypothetical protein
MPDFRKAEDARFLAQERILDALLRALAINQPRLLQAVRSILVDTEFTHAGKPGEDHSVHQQIQARLQDASAFADAHGSQQA